MAGTRNLPYGKMSPIHLQPWEDVTIRLSCKRSQRAKFQCLDLQSGQVPEWYEAQALISLGACTMPGILGLPSEERGCSLSAILEDNVPERYYLSPKACTGVLHRARLRGKKLLPLLELALRRQSGNL